MWETEAVQLGLCLPLHGFVLLEGSLEGGIRLQMSLFFDLKVLFLETASGSNVQVLRGVDRCACFPHLGAHPPVGIKGKSGLPL